MLVQTGAFPEAVEEVRAYWQIDNPATQLPPESDDLLYPPDMEEPLNASDPYAAWSCHPLLPPIKRPSDDDLQACSMAYNLKRRWQRELGHVLRRGGVPEKYLEEASPHVGNPPFSSKLLTWYRFAAASVLYEVPRLEDALTFADYGGLPSLPGERAQEEPMRGVLTERQLRERQIAAAELEAFDKIVFEKAWELRSELTEDPLSARYEVIRRYSVELEAEYARVRDECELEMEQNPPRRYYVEFELQETTDSDARETLKAIREDARLGLGGGEQEARQHTTDSVRNLPR